MTGDTISHYQILEKLGEGGMGVVYKAHDTKLDRIVALKFLPQHLAANQPERERFLQEARAASSLGHANICHINAIEESGGQQFIDMEYVDGATLRRKVPVPKLSDVYSYAVQIGEGLAEAHARGIVHRDIKCDNIMVNGKNQVKVMDFGLAKLKGSLKLTHTSSTAGTLAYMAPEQIQGGEVDARSDIFSFGVVLFEMITGRLPFRGEHEAAMMYSIVNEEPQSASQLRSDIPPDLERIIRRALEKEPEDRYQHVDDMVSELRRLQKQTSRVRRPDEAGAVAGAAGGAPLAPGFPGQQPADGAAAGVGISSPGTVKSSSSPVRRKPLLWIALAVSVAVLFWFLRGSLGGGGGGILSRPGADGPQEGGRKMLVVLPFENLGEPGQDYFADGMTEEITSKLSGLSGLGVIARSSAMQYKKTAKPVRQIGEELGVQYILQGTIRSESSGGSTRIRVNPQLINVADGTQIWSQPSEAVLASAFKLQSEIATQVADALNLALLQNERQNLEAKPTSNSEAYDAYLRGDGYLHRSASREDYRSAQEMFEQAVRLDPEFALAYAKLAGIHAHMYWEFYDHTDDRVMKSKEAAEKALQLGPGLADAHGGMGWYYYHCRLDYDDAIREFETALRLQPNNTDIVMGLASVYRRQGKFEDADDNFKKALAIDPRSADLADNAGLTLWALRRFSEAEQYFERSIILAPDWVDSYGDKATLYLSWRGDTAKAREVLERGAQRGLGRDDAFFQRASLDVELYAGKFQQALKRLENLPMKEISQQEYFIPRSLFLARVYGLVGDAKNARLYYDSARSTLEKEVRDHPDDSRMFSALGIAYAGLGRTYDAVREGERAVDLLPVSREALRGAFRLQDLAQIYTMVGKQDEALDRLERLLSRPSYLSVANLRADPLWAALRGNPRFEKLAGGAQP